MSIGFESGTQDNPETLTCQIHGKGRRFASNTSFYAESEIVGRPKASQHTHRLGEFSVKALNMGVTYPPRNAQTEEQIAAGIEMENAPHKQTNSDSLANKLQTELDGSGSNIKRLCSFGEILLRDLKISRVFTRNWDWCESRRGLMNNSRGRK